MLFYPGTLWCAVGPLHTVKTKKILRKYSEKLCFAAPFFSCSLKNVLVYFASSWSLPEGDASQIKQQFIVLLDSDFQVITTGNWKYFSKSSAFDCGQSNFELHQINNLLPRPRVLQLYNYQNCGQCRCQHTGMAFTVTHAVAFRRQEWIKNELWFSLAEKGRQFGHFSQRIVRMGCSERDRVQVWHEKERNQQWNWLFRMQHRENNRGHISEVKGDSSNHYISSVIIVVPHDILKMLLFSPLQIMYGDKVVFLTPKSFLSASYPMLSLLLLAPIPIIIICTCGGGTGKMLQLES